MTDKAYGRLLRALPKLYESHSLEHLPRHLSELLSRLVPANAVAYNEVLLRKGRLIATMNPPEMQNSLPVGAFEACMHQHPLIRHQQDTGDVTARKISDFLSRAQYQRLALYGEVYRQLRTEDQFAITLHADSHSLVALAVNRERRTFTEEDREILNEARPHLAQAYRNAEALTFLEQELRAARDRVERLPIALLVLDRRLRIRFASDCARRLMQKYFGQRAGARLLPEPVSSWLLRSSRWQGKPLPNTTGSFCMKGPSGMLKIRSTHESGMDEVLLILEETGVPVPAELLKALGLTGREAEVLSWVAEGKTNPEIAIILGAASRTVQKHLEHIFEKLGVQSRTAAARRALEAVAT
jgi:DNA-binding CsgD family transcriptional regulator